ncbi:cecropin-like [Bombyx mori]|uniref:cecropin-like n=1 Tax=Bombyx mori TaxID=7091 RepID=UPI00024B613D
MNFVKILCVVLALMLALSMASAALEPKRKVFKIIEKIGRNVRGGVITAGPAVVVVGQAASVGM